MGVEAERSKRPLHPSQPEVVRSPSPAETPAWTPASIAPEWLPSAQSAPASLAVSAQADGRPGASDHQRRSAGRRPEPGAILQLQRSHGNSHTCRVIERSRGGSLATAPALEPAHHAQRPHLNLVPSHTSVDRVTMDGEITPCEAMEPETAPAPGEISASFAAPSDPSNPAANPGDNPSSVRPPALRLVSPGIGTSRAEAARATDLQVVSGMATSTRTDLTRQSSGTGGPIQRDFLDTLSDAADSVSDFASDTANTVTEVASDAVDTVSDVAGAAVDAAGDLAESAADAVSGLIDSALSEIRGAFDSIVGQITEAWDAVQSGVTSVVDAAIEQASGFLGGIGSLFSALSSALGELNAGALRSAWAAITGAADSALAGVRDIVTNVTGMVDGIWGGLKGTAQGLIAGLHNQAEGLIGRLPGVAQGPARSAWNSIAQALTSTWTKIESTWTSLRATALKRVNQVVDRVAGIVTTIKTSVVSTIIDTVERVSALFTLVKKLIANPDLIIDPITREVVGLLQPLPEKSKSDIQTRAQAQGGGGPSAAPASAGVTPGGPALQRLVQRDAAKPGDPRSTLPVGKVISTSWDFLTNKLGKLFGNLWENVKEMVVGILSPSAIAKGLVEDWTKMTTDLSKRAARLEHVRMDSWDGFWEDIRRAVSDLIDFPLIIWRTVNTMLGRLSVYIGLALILGGAVLGAIAGGTGGAIFGSIVPAAGTAGGGIAGIAAGAWAGAQAGYAAAETVGLVLLASFVVAEQVSIGKALADLIVVPQTTEEQEEDFNQATDSTVALISAGLLALIAWMAVRLAKGLWSFLRNLPERFNPKPTVDPPPKPVDVDPPGPKPNEPVPGDPNAIVICRACVKLVDVPADLINRRNSLSPDMKKFFDNELGRRVNDATAPTPAEFDAFNKFLDDIEKANGGDLEKGLQAERAGQPGIEPPTGVAPQRAIDAANYAKANGGAAQPGHAGNVPFANDGRQGGHILPRKDAAGKPITYTEYDVNPLKPGVNRGKERIVISSEGKAYWTDTHYDKFVRFQ